LGISIRGSKIKINVYFKKFGKGFIKVTWVESMKNINEEELKINNCLKWNTIIMCCKWLTSPFSSSCIFSWQKKTITFLLLFSNHYKFL